MVSWGRVSFPACGPGTSSTRLPWSPSYRPGDAWPTWAPGPDFPASSSDLDNVSIRRARAEEVKDRYDVVTARAVANLSKLVRLTAPLLRPGGALLALKGMRAQDEVDDAKYVIKKAKLSVAVAHEVVTAGDETTAVVEIRRPKNR